jgi:hypothetical protein
VAVNQWITIIRKGRVTPDLYKKMDVPEGVSSINIPKITGGTTTALQSTQNSALSQTDMTTSYIQASWATIGGKQVVAQQLLDQTAVNFDQIILEGPGGGLRAAGWRARLHRYWCWFGHELGCQRSAQRHVRYYADVDAGISDRGAVLQPDR